jgi:transposase
MNNVDTIRFEQYRQIRKEIRGSRDYLIVGIDVAKDKHYAFFGTATGPSLALRFLNTFAPLYQEKIVKKENQM